MADSKAFACSVVTPERVVIECQARFVALPAHDGEVGVLSHRAPLVTRLDVGPLRIEKSDGQTESFFIDGGFAEMAGERLTVLTESAVAAAELTRGGAEALLAEAREMAGVDEVAHAARQRAMRKARAQLRMLG
jgi:F-type H+-transporting ATPase subunit epsilon